jgi:hypothetical protein
MRTAALIVGPAAFLALLLVASAALPRGAEPRPKRLPTPVDRITAKLNQLVDMEPIDDPNTTMKEALDLLSARHGLTIAIDLRAFEYEGYKDVEGTLIADPKPHPAWKRVRLARVMEALVDRLPVPSGACFVVREGCVEITTQKFRTFEICGTSFSGPCPKLVTVHFEDLPLEEALRDLASQAKLNLLIDRRLADRARLPVTARLRDVPLETALLLLTDMAEVEIVHRDNVLYVTTRDHAAELERRFTRERPLWNSDGEPVDPARWRKGKGPPVDLWGGARGAAGM